VIVLRTIMFLLRSKHPSHPRSSPPSFAMPFSLTSTSLPGNARERLGAQLSEKERALQPERAAVLP
jgi:hypothetical protein